MIAERQRLTEAREHQADWKKWGPYLSERQWGTVREDYSRDGSAWDYFSHQHSLSRAYRWGEDGIAGISDPKQQLCFAVAFWNEKDPILKERLFGLTGSQGNHGEDVKEYYFHLDNTPTHSYMKYLYKYPQSAYPYAQLVEENQRRDRYTFEYELLDTGIFDDNRYFDIFIEYAKASPEDILIQIKISNRGNESKRLHILPTLWFRNTWSWDKDASKPYLKAMASDESDAVIEAFHPTLGKRWLYCAVPERLLFTENETNHQALFGTDNTSAYLKDGINNYVVNGDKDAVNHQRHGTKAAAHYILEIEPNQTQTVKLRLSNTSNLAQPFDTNFDEILQTRIREADEFYQQIAPNSMSEATRQVQRQAFAGMLWNKQYYRYSIQEWLQGDSTQPSPPPERQQARNHKWFHFDSDEVLSMPDKWEYPWFASWDSAFHTIPLALIDPDFAKNQLDLLTREWYMHPNGQIPAYEWNFNDVNPPVHAWATWRVYQIDRKMSGRADRPFLERVFQKLLLYFTWWVNREDAEGKNIFQGGFLGLDNIGLFDRSAPIPNGGRLEQADGTSWMAMFCLNMLKIALELARENPVYEDIATKFFEHFIYIADAINHIGTDHTQMWDEEDGFYYDVLHLTTSKKTRLRVRSLVGLLPLFAVDTIEPDLLEKLPGFKERLEWFIEHRPELSKNIACTSPPGVGERRLLAIVHNDKLRHLLAKMLDEAEFFSPYGIRSVSRYHQEHPYVFHLDGQEYRVDYQPAESTTGLFGGNSNWRGPVWFPVNLLIIESLQKYHHYLGDDFKVECPTGSGRWITLWDVSLEIEKRLIRIFLPDASGKRPVAGGIERFQSDPHWCNLTLFHEYFHGDNGAGLGASHQTGWTGVVAKLIQQHSEYGGKL